MEQCKHYSLIILSTILIWANLQWSTLSAVISEGERQGRQIGVSTTATPNPNATLEYGVGCGTIPMRPNHIIRLQSSNFGVGNYYNKDACSWTFTASSCALSVYCPCFNIPYSLGCLSDYLKISHLHFSDKFCGESSPIGVYRSSSDSISLKFRSDYKGSGKGFLCYVRCTGTGFADPIAPNVTCPANTVNPYGHPI